MLNEFDNLTINFVLTKDKIKKTQLSDNISNKNYKEFFNLNTTCLDIHNVRQRKQIATIKTLTLTYYSFVSF